MIVIIPPDNRVTVNGVTKTVPLDLPHINCARLHEGKGSIEHCKHNGEWLAPRTLTQDEFLGMFADVISRHADAKTDEEIHAEEHAARQVAAAMPPPEEYVPTREDYLIQLEVDADRARSRFITTRAGMAAVYAEKAAEAIAVDAMGRDAANALPDNGADDFPLLAVSVGIEAETLYDVAELVSNRAEESMAKLAEIERVRLTVKRAMKAVETTEEVKAIYEAVIWP